MNNICKTSIAVALGSFFAMSSYAKDVLVVWEDLNKAHSIDMAVADFEKNNDCKVVVREFNPVNHLELADSSDEKPDVFIIISDKADYAKESGRIEKLDYMSDVKDLYLENSVKPYDICHSPQQKSDFTFSSIFVQTLVPSASMPLCSHEIQPFLTVTPYIFFTSSILISFSVHTCASYTSCGP